jgi:hypothetical protein
MKKLFGLWNLEEAGRFHPPVKIITTCNRLVYFGTAKYVIFLYPDAHNFKPLHEG